MEKIKRDIEKLRTKLKSIGRFPLKPEAKMLLRLYAQGLHDWQQPPYRQPLKKLYMEALEEFGPELSQDLTSKTLFWLLFIIQFRGGKDSEKAEESLLEAYLLARKIAPKAMEELFSGNEERKAFLKIIDKVLSEPEENEDKT